MRVKGRADSDGIALRPDTAVSEPMAANNNARRVRWSGDTCDAPEVSPQSIGKCDGFAIGNVPKRVFTEPRKWRGQSFRQKAYAKWLAPRAG
jgi:hypothetical protein